MVLLARDLEPTVFAIVISIPAKILGKRLISVRESAIDLASLEALLNIFETVSRDGAVKIDLFYSFRPSTVRLIVNFGRGVGHFLGLPRPLKKRLLIIHPSILRDTALARWLKHIYDYECQVCGMAIELFNGGRYAEVHHIQPLGAPHNGPDILENMLVLCPNHHAMCDLGAIRLSLKELRISKNHPVSLQKLEYHNVRVLEEIAQQSVTP